MIYKFDIHFKKTLSNGVIKVVSYANLMENPKAFGEDENLEGVVGELSVVKEGNEAGFSLNSLLRKYHTTLVGKLNADNWTKEFPLRFTFSNQDDVESICTELIDERGYLYSSVVETKVISGELKLNLECQDSFVLILVKKNRTELVDNQGTSMLLEQGEVGFVMASVNSITIMSTDSIVKFISSK